MDSYKRYEPIFGEWTITKLLGEGSFGKVYEMERVDFGRTYKAALKIITVPSNMSELKNVMFESMDQSSVVDYFYSCVEEVIDEFTLMSKLKGNSNIVSYENHKVIEHTNEIGWDILIQMELLTPLNEYISKTQLTQWDVIKLGIDICKALEVCHRYNIIHRDIKPENIFISDLGDYKLGDFGIARTIEKTTNGLSKKGTYGYMAPEVYKGDPYGTSVDIYSLGLVLYRLMNNNRLPFLPPYPLPIRYSDQDQAMLRRLRGETIPNPQNASVRLAEIILKAISYKPESRYSSPEAMRRELESIQFSRQKSEFVFKEIKTLPSNHSLYRIEESKQLLGINGDKITLKYNSNEKSLKESFEEEDSKTVILIETEYEIADEKENKEVMESLCEELIDNAKIKSKEKLSIFDRLVLIVICIVTITFFILAPWIFLNRDLSNNSIDLEQDVEVDNDVENVNQNVSELCESEMKQLVPLINKREWKDALQHVEIIKEIDADKGNEALEMYLDAYLDNKIKYYHYGVIDEIVQICKENNMDISKYINVMIDDFEENVVYLYHRNDFINIKKFYMNKYVIGNLSPKAAFYGILSKLHGSTKYKNLTTDERTLVEQNILLEDAYELVSSKVGEAYVIDIIFNE